MVAFKRSSLRSTKSGSVGEGNWKMTRREYGGCIGEERAVKAMCSGDEG